MRKSILPAFAALWLVACSPTEVEQKLYTLWYTKPATHFEETLVLGNGKMGATVYGGVAKDSIHLNDITLWSGEPVNVNMNPGAYKNIPAIREALFHENYPLADSLNKTIQGSFSQSYAPLGNLLIETGHSPKPGSYYRELNLNDAYATVRYETDNARFTREYFVSHPDQVMVMKLSSDKKGALSCTLRMGSLLPMESRIEGSTLITSGYAPYHAEPSYRGDMPNAVRFDPARGTRFTCLIDIRATDGTVRAEGTHLVLSDATEAEVIISIATSFNGFDKNPATQGADHQAIAQTHSQNSHAFTYKQLKERHTTSYQALFNRVRLQLADRDSLGMATDERLKRYFSGAADPYLEELYFQFGRYLLISSSRTPQVPANLQGLWNPYMRPPWSSNYTTNINVEENYWMAETANLSELHHPLLGFIKNLAQTGRVSAKSFYGVDQGWSVAHNSDIWAMSNPVGDFGQGDPVWANWNMGGAWLSTHLWEHYLFTQDKEFLKAKGYPLMKGAAEFCLGWLVEDKEGKLVTAPSTSPENKYRTTDGYVGATLYGATADLAMIRELFANTIRATEVLGVDESFALELQSALMRLHPYQVGKQGQLLEWYHDWEDPEPWHRHQSHLFGLYPGHHITPEQTPDLAEACKKTLNIKGDKSTGWSQGWRINLWARLRDGNRAYKMYRELLSYVDPTGTETNYSNGGGTYPNLLDAHPPFQIDGNFGGSAGVIEMLVQSTETTIELLPALPDAWSSGRLLGVRTRGGFEVDLEWKGGRLIRASLFSEGGGKTKLIYGDVIREIGLDAGERNEIRW